MFVRFLMLLHREQRNFLFTMEQYKKSDEITSEAKMHLTCFLLYHIDTVREVGRVGRQGGWNGGGWSGGGWRAGGAREVVGEGRRGEGSRG